MMTKTADQSAARLVVSGGESEDGIVVGNTYDKYGARNPVVRRIMRGFEGALEELVRLASPRTIHEIGCGEGHWTLRWAAQGFDVRGSDFSAKVIELARSNAGMRQLPAELFTPRSVYELEAGRDSADLVVCCEVLEHLEMPEAALDALQAVVTQHLVLSVPREPVWSLMNMARGRYWSALGNTPGHLQRWSQREFTRLVARYFRIEELRSPLPWTMVLCTPLAPRG
jgi:2-polyprenyl-3-methyl-5-hydroxy-6-metoxy-1,4-benzoquinol methylase